MNIVLAVFNELDSQIVSVNKERHNEGLPGIERAQIKVLGQMALILNEEISQRIPLFSTQDVDALVQGEWIVTSIFKTLLENNGLQFDFLSTEIWIPDGATYHTIFSGQSLDCEILDPISVLVSKAIKAPEKNRILVRQALTIYGNLLEEKIIENKGDVEFFKKKNKVTL